MLVDLWHHYLLLRPLLVFVLAAPLLVLAVLFRGRGRPPSAQRETHEAAGAPGAVRGGEPRAEREARVAATPREWRVRTEGSDRRAA